MTSESIDWDEDLPGESEEEYQTFIRTLQRTDGFRLLFVRCSPVESQRLIAKVKTDITDKNIEVLRLQKPINNFYKLIENLDHKEQINVLFVTGLEHSLYDYEDTKRLTGWTSKEIYSYSWKGVPRILINLNKQREQFRDKFNICFVFIVPLFVIKYLIQRAPDFFDWRSGLFEFPTDKETLTQESLRILQEGDYEKYILLTPAERNQKILMIRELLAEQNQNQSHKVDLLIELGELLFVAKEYEHALASYEQALEIKPNSYVIWNKKGMILCDFLKLYEEAIASFDKALAIKPDYYKAYYNRGIALSNLGRFSEALTSLDKALKIKPDYYRIWHTKGYVLNNLGNYIDAVLSFDKALKINEYDYLIWECRSIALLNLGRVDEANASLEKARKIKAYINRIKNKLDNLYSDLDRKDECNLKTKTIVEEFAQAWRTRLAIECPQQSLVNREHIICWLLGADTKRFNTLNGKELQIARQAMEYKYRILQQRYLGVGRERAYRNLIARLGSLAILRSKIQAWIELSRDRRRKVLDVLQEVVQELLRKDNYIRQQIDFISRIATNVRLRDALLFASVEEYCLRPVRNQPLLAYRFINYLRRSQRGGLTQVPNKNMIRMVSDEMLTNDRENQVSLVDLQTVTKHLEEQKQIEQQLLRHEVKEKFEEYLRSNENLGEDAVRWLRLYLQGKSQNEIAKTLNKPIKEVYRLREKISYHAIRVFALKDKPELIDNWLGVSIEDHNLGLTPNKWQELQEKLTQKQLKILELRKTGIAFDAIAEQLKMRTHQVMGEWTKIYLAAQTLRTQE